MLRMPRWVLACASAVLITPCVSFAEEYNTDKIGNVLKSAHNDLTIVCAHRGLHGTAIGTNAHPDWLRNVPENSIAAIEQAHDAKIECSEIDLQLDRAGHVILLHDSNLGRTTNVTTVGRTSDYDPYIPSGYNPALSNYFGNPLDLYLRNPLRNGYTNQKVPSLDDVLTAIKNQRIAMILLLDVKNIEAAKKAWQIVKAHTNAWGTPAERWVYFKMPVNSIGMTAGEFETKGIINVQSEGGRFRLIPVFGADAIDTSGGPANLLRNWQGYYDKNYVYATEVRLKEFDSTLHFPLNNIMQKYDSGLLRNGKTVGAYQPVPETKNNQYFAADGHCCTGPAFWHWESKKGFGKETGDNRPDLHWIIHTAHDAFRYIISDDPVTAMHALKDNGRRNMALISN
ncbi:glycerophosphodiester phosphodiesterase family protein [Pseudomonas viridiflava]|uniref:glycerophosphodiester phosphodiesterase family protein n=1 Tax=Pseudomonas viridiflava TaxID=33069 RepID=UPI000F021C8E|nr:glycerophosphodiester phosphodiesterase family protein [Pseudomonas viridiflava]MEE4149437.1 glycerophosphodiester phosphodiesterase family protein [Pseudomonas viridiflava]